MENIFYNSKEQIKNRIIQNAMDFWNIRNTQDMDPFVKLLIEALCTELFNLSNDLQDMENRVMDKISRILAPDLLTSPLPAHAILYGRSVEPTDVLNERDHFNFTYKKSNDGADDRQPDTPISFTPLGNVRLFNAGVRYLFTGNMAYEYNETLHRHLAFSAAPGAQLERDSVWIGLQLPPAEDALNGLYFYFDWRNYSVDTSLYGLIKLCRIHHNQHELELVPGLLYVNGKEPIENPIFHDLDLLHLLKRDIHDFYEERYLTIQQTPETTITAMPYPEEFAKVFSPAQLGRLQEPLVWLRISFPAAITPELLQELYIDINAFPVVNRKLINLKHRLKGYDPIVPVRTQEHEHLLGIERLLDNQGSSYSELPYSKNNYTNEGSYALRNGGAERFDSRRAKETIAYLFELLRDEKAAFSSYGPDFINTTLKNLEQNLSLMEKKAEVKGGQAEEQLSYVVVRPKKNADILFLEYWVTHAELANKIRSGSRLQQFGTNKLKSSNIILLSNATGGRKRLMPAERIQAFKYGLTTRDRIVSKADLVNFCFNELGAAIQNVTIKRGLELSVNPKEGFRKTIDVHLSPSAGNTLDPAEWNTMFALMLSKLKTRSMMNVTHRFFLS